MRTVATVLATANIKQFVNAGTVRLFLEVDDLNVPVIKSHFGEVQLCLAADVQIECVTGRIDSIIRIDPFFIAGNCFGVSPHDSFARRQRHHDRAPGQRRKIDQRMTDEYRPARSPHYLRLPAARDVIGWPGCTTSLARATG